MPKDYNSQYCAECTDGPYDLEFCETCTRYLCRECWPCSECTARDNPPSSRVSGFAGGLHPQKRVWLSLAQSIL